MAWFPSKAGTGEAVCDSAAEEDTLDGGDRIGFGVEESIAEGLLDGFDFQGESTG